MSGRRAFLALAGLGLAYWGARSVVPSAWARYGPLPDVTSAGMPDGFQKLESEAQLSGGFANPLIGLGETPSKPQPLDDAALCQALFAGSDGRLTLSYFTDYNCPYCRVLGRDLKTLATQRSQEMVLRYHELPLLGPGSVIGAKAALAARKQGQYDQMHRLLNTGVVRINQAYVEKIGQEIGLDLGKLRADMEGPSVTRSLATSQAAAERFAVIGTPFLLIGRTAVYGRIKPELLDRLASLELARRAPDTCA
ncbi:MAG: DsbA family protein [Litoreibacter sp.]|nr:DsbA family protein [Litoreibacter sp.]